MKSVISIALVHVVVVLFDMGVCTNAFPFIVTPTNRSQRLTYLSMQYNDGNGHDWTRIEADAESKVEKSVEAHAFLGEFEKTAENIVIHSSGGGQSSRTQKKVTAGKTHSMIKQD